MNNNLDFLIEAWNSDYVPLNCIDQSIAVFAYNNIHSIKRQFLRDYEPDKESAPLRLSSIGKTYAFELLSKKMGLLKAVPQTHSEKLKLILSIGDWFEAYFNFFLHRLDYTILETQTEVFWHGVQGHTDAQIMDDQGNKFLIEVKTSSDFYFKQVKARGYPDDSRGYLTQLCCYADALGYPPECVYWVFLNKCSQELALFPLSNVPEDEREYRLERAKELITLYEQCTEVEDVFKLSQPPPPAIEKDKQGNYKVHPDGRLRMYPLSTVQHPHYFYILEERRTQWGKKRDYVLDYNYPEKYRKYKPTSIEQDAIEYDG